MDYSSFTFWMPSMSTAKLERLVKTLMNRRIKDESI